MSRGDEADPEDLRRQLRGLLCDRGAPEAQGLFEVLSRYAHRRVGVVSRHCGQILSEGEQEEVVGEVLLQLMQGALASFRGETLPELLGFVRTITDRTTWRTVRRRDRERHLLQSDRELIEEWTSEVPRPDAHLEVVSDSPLPDVDQSYLRELLTAGSKAELARRSGVSRAAVTQRVQRICVRIAGLAPMARFAHEAWLNQAARRVLEAESEPELVLAETADADG